MLGPHGPAPATTPVGPSLPGGTAKRGASVSAPDTFQAGRREILREASVALGGRSVMLWEFSSHDEMAPQASSEAVAGQTSPTTNLDIYSALRRWKVPIVRGSRWVVSRSASDGTWIIAPVRTRPPAPPPAGLERRSRERLTLELAGLCVGLVDRREAAEQAQRADPLHDLVNLPAVIVHEASNPLTTARLTLQLAMESLSAGKERAVDATDLLQDLRQVIHDIDRAVDLLRAVQDRARGALARSERFDAVRVVRSCCTLESRLLRERGMTLTFQTALDSIHLKGDPNAIYDLLVNLIRNAADASVGRPGPIEIRLEQVGQMFRLCVQDHGTGIPAEHLDRIFEPGFTTKEFGKGTGMGLAVVDSVAHTMYGGTVSVDSAVGVGTTFTVALPIPPQRSSDPALRALELSSE